MNKPKPTTSNKLQDIMLALQGRDFSKAINLAEQALKKNYRDIDALYLKAIALLESSQTLLSKETFKKILQLNPNHLSSLIELAQLEADDNNLSEALALGEKASKLDSKNLQIKFFLIGTLIKKEDYDNARTTTNEILKNQPKNDLALYLLAMSYFKEKNHPEGCKHAIKALEINPKLLNLRVLMSEYYGRYELKYPLAIKLLEEEINLNPNSNDAYKFLGNYYGKLGEIEKAIEFTKHQIKLNPTSYESHSNLLFFLPYAPNTNNDQILEAANDFYQKCFNNKNPINKNVSYNKDPHKKLKIGFVSGDFRNHALFFWLKGFFAELKKNNCEVFCYCNNLEDEITQSWKQEANIWRSILGKSDADAYQQIQTDEIDILIDLSGHTEHNRLGIFNLKPAPIQITWLGQSGPLGIPGIDYMISDNYMVEPGEEIFYNEKILRLPNIYAPYANEAKVPINKAPCTKNGYITFGCLNNFIKINKEVTKTWIEILSQIKDSRLILKSHLFADPNTIINLENYFLQFGISKERLLLEPFDLNREQYLKTYSKIDIALDPFPFGGGTTTHDLILMGIPLITLYGKRLSNRSSASILHHIGCPELITYSKEEYINKAIKLASDYESIKTYREILRDKYLSSPLNDLDSFAKNFSNTLKTIWHDYCLKE
jgi:protein O-GlcNAc transferase